MESSLYLQAAAELADGLAEPLLVLDQGEAEDAFAGLSEPPARADCDLGLFQELHNVKSIRPIFDHLQGSGISAQTNMPAFGVGTFQPSRLRDSTITSRRIWYSATWASLASSPCRSATIAAIWTAWKIP